MQKYNPQKIEKKWQKYWEQKKTFVAKDFSKKKKEYVLVEFPYPSGAGLHMGHLRPYVAGDVYSRFNRLRGFETLFPIGWDAFGLPAENYAIKMGVHPSKTTAQNIKNAKRQLQSWGMSFDWSREINTTDPNYYKWTQWIFLQFYKAGLAYEKTGLINWCPKDKTGLANEEVIDGKCERCGTPVEKKELKQWYLKITAYAEKLLQGLKELDKWPDAVKLQQENWIGKSIGAQIDFYLDFKKNPADNDRRGPNGERAHLSVFTTRPDTTFGATYLVLAPEHIWVRLATDDNHDVLLNKDEVKAYIESVKNKTEIDRTAEGEEKTGVELKGVKAINPATKEEIPVWVADYVLGGYGTGAIMAVPAHDQRDFEFARKFNLPVKEVVAEETGIQRENEERRDGGCGIIFDPVSQKYAVAKSPDGTIRLFAGGVEDGEDLQTGVLREVTEESGLYDFKHVEKIQTCFAHFYNGRKNVNRAGLATCYLAILGSNRQKEKNLAPHEQELHLYWASADEIMESWKSRNQEGNVEHWIRYLNKAVSRAIELGFDKTSDAKKYSLTATANPGYLIDSGKFTGMKSEEALPEMAEAFGKITVQYKLRDWVFSRQRYWGEPIPIIHCEKCGVVPVPEKDLPVKLPPVKKYEPTGTGESPLAAIKSWVNTKCPKCKGPAKRETNTMPQWAGSSWYWLRYTDPKDKKTFADKKKQKYWTPVDVYFGGMEHTTLHLLYSRFWNLFLYDRKLVTVKEPYVQRRPHGIILGPDGEKMSKSRGNVVNPDDIVKQHGADTLRMYELFLGPHELTVSWNDQGILGVKRFLDRVWYWIYEQDKKAKDSEKAEKALHKLIKKITEDLENFRFNTAVSSFMEFYNDAKQEPVSQKSIKVFLTLLYPFAPHIAEELHQVMGGKKSLQLESWPKFDPKKVVDSTVDVVVQVNGKVKGKITVPAGSREDHVKEKALGLEAVKNIIAGRDVKRVIYVSDKLINLVV